MKALDQSQTLDLVKKLIEFPSVSSNEDAIAGYLHQFLPSVFGAKVERVGHNVIVKLGDPDAKHRLLLCSHIDTVQAADGWTRDPFKATVEGKKIYGLGANDALASVVSMTAALSRVQQNVKGGAGITLALVAEEEKGDAGFFTIEKSLKYTSAIFGEPTDLRIGIAMRGYMHLRVKGEGHACHASRPWEGKNAIVDLVHQLERVSNLDLKDDSPWGQATVEPTVISGGKSTNQIPDKAEALLDIRPTPTINNEAVLKKLDDIGCRYDVIHNRRRPLSCPEDSEVFTAAKTAHPAAKTYAFGGTCDMAFSTQPSVIIGPGKSERSHAADEYIEEGEIAEGIAFYESILAKYLELYSG